MRYLPPRMSPAAGRCPVASSGDVSSLDSAATARILDPDLPPASFENVKSRALRVQRALDDLVARPDLRARASFDPVSFVHAYSRAIDQELVALLAASLAFGNVKAFRPKIQGVLDV